MSPPDSFAIGHDGSGFRQGGQKQWQRCSLNETAQSAQKACHPDVERSEDGETLRRSAATLRSAGMSMQMTPLAIAAGTSQKSEQLSRSNQLSLNKLPEGAQSRTKQK